MASQGGQVQASPAAASALGAAATSGGPAASSTTSSLSTTPAASSNAAATPAPAVEAGGKHHQLDEKELVVPQGADGVASELPVIAYTEQVIAEKEATLRKYLQENYAKLHAVEKELEALTLEVKLTSGSKKAAMEHLRRKIEETSERVKTAKAKEIVAKKAWEAAAKAVADEEEAKQKLCDDLRTMIQESARQQYEKLESLTQKLDALNPEMRGVAMQAIEGLRARIAPHGLPVLNGGTDSPAAPATANHEASRATTGGSTAAANSTTTSSALSSSSPVSASPAPASQWASGVQSGIAPTDASAAAAPSQDGQQQHPQQQQQQQQQDGMGRGGGRQLRGRGRGGLLTGRGSRGRGQRGVAGDGTGWTGAGFDVDDDGIL